MHLIHFPSLILFSFITYILSKYFNRLTKVKKTHILVNVMSMPMITKTLYTFLSYLAINYNLCTDAPTS